MRGIVLSITMIVWSIMSLAQEKENWRNYIKESFSSKEHGKEEVFLIERSLSEIRNASNQLQILRSIDESHHIVKGKIDNELNDAWVVNDQWKLNLQKSISHSLYYVVVSPDFSLSDFSNVEVLKNYPSVRTFLISASHQAIEESVLHNPEVIHITNKIYKPRAESRVIDLNLNPNRVNKVHHVYPALNGSTEVVSIQENSFDVNDIDLLNRSQPSGLESELMDNHATEMATIIAGAGNSFVTGRGVAQKATIISSDFFDAMPDADQAYLDFGVNTQNHSYGIFRVSEYGVEAMAFDQSAYQNKNLLHVFSSGNEGLEISEDGIYSGVEGYANLTGNIKMSKNSLVVGSADTVGNVPSFVSRGPTYDGRVKPEVVAYSVVGSSNSAALVSGVATLLQQQYREANGTDMPSALAKALIINGATDVGPEGLDFLTGYGNVNAWRSLETLRNLQYNSGVIDQGAVESYALNLPANATNLKVTLCWTDPAANANDFPALVNNLDLRLVDASASVTLPWVLDSTPNVSDLGKAAIRAIDELNNAEQVTIDNPGTTYTIEVEASTVLGPQDFFIAWHYDIENSFEWDFPTGSDNMPYNGETGSYFRWTSTIEDTGVLSYSTDDVNWTTLDASIELGVGYWRWNNPPLIGDEVRARMEVGVDVFETELFTLSEPHSANVGFNCGDSLMLRWNSVPNALDYTIYSLGVEVLEEYQTTADTFLVVADKESFSSTRFSIQPNLQDGKQLLPTPSFDYTLQGIECYVFSLFQTVALDTGIYLNLSLGTTYGIDRIVFERYEFSAYEEIGTITQPDKETYSFLDETPIQGYNEHRATIYFINGEELIFSAGTSFYLTEEPLRIFPNPIQAGEPLEIITKDFEETSPILELVDHKGAVIYRQTIRGTQDVIPTEGLQSGIYFYRLHADGELHSGRVMIR